MDNLLSTEFVHDWSKIENIDFFDSVCNLDDFPFLMSLSVGDRIIGLGGWNRNPDGCSANLFISFSLEYSFSQQQKDFIIQIEETIFLEQDIKTISVIVHSESLVGFFKSLGWQKDAFTHHSGDDKFLLKKYKL